MSPRIPQGKSSEMASDVSGAGTTSGPETVAVEVTEADSVKVSEMASDVSGAGTVTGPEVAAGEAAEDIVAKPSPGIPIGLIPKNCIAMRLCQC